MRVAAGEGARAEEGAASAWREQDLRLQHQGYRQSEQLHGHGQLQQQEHAQPQLVAVTVALLCVVCVLVVALAGALFARRRHLRLDRVHRLFSGGERHTPTTPVSLQVTNRRNLELMLRQGDFSADDYELLVALDDDVVGPRGPASESVIRNLPVFRLPSDGQKKTTTTKKKKKQTKAKKKAKEDRTQSRLSGGSWTARDRRPRFLLRTRRRNNSTEGSGSGSGIGGCSESESDSSASSGPRNASPEREDRLGLFTANAMGLRHRMTPPRLGSGVVRRRRASSTQATTASSSTAPRVEASPTLQQANGSIHAHVLDRSSRRSRRSSMPGSRGIRTSDNNSSSGSGSGRKMNGMEVEGNEKGVGTGNDGVSSTRRNSRRRREKRTSTASASSTGSNYTGCAVCLEPMRGDLVKLLPCLHRFHVDCINKWLRIRSVCPICKHPVVLPSPTHGGLLAR